MKIDLSQLISAETKAVEAQAVLAAELAHLRWRHEVGGVVVPKLGRVATDRETQARLAGLVQALEAGLIAGPVAWKAAEGWMDLDAKALRGLAQAVTAHVQASFAAERGTLALLEAGKITPQGVQQAFEAALG